MGTRKSRTILVTGGAGHVGSHVVEQLATAEPESHIISLDNYSAGRGENHIDLPNVTYIKGDTIDIFDLRLPKKLDRIFHLGEYARIAPSLEEPLHVLKNNIQGTATVVEFCRKMKVPKLVYAASSTKFADNNTGRDLNPYSFSKATNVELVSNYGKWYGLEHAICYFYNAYGPREQGTGKYFTVIAKFQEENKRGEPHHVWGSGEQKRNFTYVADIARGMIMVGEKGTGDGFALNHPQAHSVLEVAKAFGGPIIFDEHGYAGRSGSGENPTRAHELGWSSTLDIMDWIKDFVAKYPHPLPQQIAEA